MSQRLIVFAGHDGSGKSTQILMLAEKLRMSGVEVATLHVQAPATQAEARILRRLTAWARVSHRPTAIGHRWVRSIAATCYALFSVGKTGLRFMKYRRTNAVLLLDRSLVDEGVRLEFRLGLRSRVIESASRLSLFQPGLTIAFRVDETLGWSRKKTKHLSLDDYRRKVSLTTQALGRVTEPYNVHWITVDGKDPYEVHREVVGLISKAGLVL